jgi:CheY-like chemotaxis protein
MPVSAGLEPGRRRSVSCRGATLSLIDIDALKHHVNEAERARGEAERANLAKDEFLATLSHEIRTPLSSMLMHAQLLGRGALDPVKIKRAAEAIERGTRMQVRLVDDLLDVSRITRGKVALQKEPARLSEMVEAAVETVKPLIDVRRQQLSVDLGHDAWLDADKARLSQVFGNMLNNASKFTPGGGRIALTARHAPDGVTIEVRDNGMGIPREQLKSIFDMFEQVDHSIERAHSGLGIGLTIVKSMVEMHGGTVEAASDGAGKGATFRVRLPTRAAPRAAAPLQEKASALARARLKLLVVDDNRDSAQSLGMMLELLGHEVQVEYDGPGALRTVDHFSPHAVFLDIGLPGMDGFDVCRRLRAGGRADDVVVIAQTGWGDPAQRARSQEAGFDHHLVKPVDVATLKSLLSDIAGRDR